MQKSNNEKSSNKKLIEPTGVPICMDEAEQTPVLSMKGKFAYFYKAQAIRAKFIKILELKLNEEYQSETCRVTAIVCTESISAFKNFALLKCIETDQFQLVQSLML